MDAHLVKRLLAGALKAMGRAGGHDHDLSRVGADRGVVDRELGDAALDDERLLVRVAMELRPDPGGCEVMKNEPATSLPPSNWIAVGLERRSSNSIGSGMLSHLLGRGPLRETVVSGFPTDSLAPAGAPGGIVAGKPVQGGGAAAGLAALLAGRLDQPGGAEIAGERRRVVGGGGDRLVDAPGIGERERVREDPDRDVRPPQLAADAVERRGEDRPRDRMRALGVRPRRPSGRTGRSAGCPAARVPDGRPSESSPADRDPGRANVASCSR